MYLVLVTISNIPLLICNHFHIRQANSDKITTFYGGTHI